MVLKAPKLEGDNLTFDVSVLEGDLTNATGSAALFIDWFAARGYGGRAVVAGGPAWHGAWYGHPAAAFRRRGSRGRGGCSRTRILTTWATCVWLLPLSALLLRLADLGRKKLQRAQAAPQLN